jgi:hypothetical protein
VIQTRGARTPACSVHTRVNALLWGGQSWLSSWAFGLPNGMKACRSIAGQVANLRPIGNRPVATPNVFSTGCAGLSTVQPAFSRLLPPVRPVGFCRKRRSCEGSTPARVNALLWGGQRCATSYVRTPTRDADTAAPAKSPALIPSRSPSDRSSFPTCNLKPPQSGSRPNSRAA